MSHWSWLEKLLELKALGAPAVLVTVIDCKGSTPREAGAKMLVDREGNFFGTIGGGHLEELALKDASRILKDNVSRKITYPLGAKTGQCCGGQMELFFEVFNGGPQLYVFGGGHVGQAVCKTLAGTPFNVHLVDERPEWINASDLPTSVSRHESHPLDFISQALWTEDKIFAVVMTHSHSLDQDIIEALLKRPAAYIGLIGSDSKWKKFSQRFLARGFSPPELKRVTCPIGLIKGGKSPQEVAISLSCELLSLHYRNLHQESSIYDSKNLSPDPSGSGTVPPRRATQRTHSLPEQNMD